MTIIILYLLGLFLGMIGGIGIVNEELNKVTSGIRFFGVITICLRVLIRYDSILHTVGIILISIVGAFISFTVVTKRRGGAVMRKKIKLSTDEQRTMKIGFKIIENKLDGMVNQVERDANNINLSKEHWELTKYIVKSRGYLKDKLTQKNWSNVTEKELGGMCFITANFMAELEGHVLNPNAEDVVKPLLVTIAAMFKVIVRYMEIMYPDVDIEKYLYQEGEYDWQGEKNDNHISPKPYEISKELVSKIKRGCELAESFIISTGMVNCRPIVPVIRTELSLIMENKYNGNTGNPLVLANALIFLNCELKDIMFALDEEQKEMMNKFREELVGAIISLIHIHNNIKVKDCEEPIIFKNQVKDICETKYKGDSVRTYAYGSLMNDKEFLTNNDFIHQGLDILRYIAAKILAMREDDAPQNVYDDQMWQELLMAAEKFDKMKTMLFEKDYASLKEDCQALYNLCALSVHASHEGGMLHKDDSYGNAIAEVMVNFGDCLDKEQSEVCVRDGMAKALRRMMN